MLWRAPEGRGFSPAAKRAPTHSKICGQGVDAAGLKPRPSEALISVFPQPLGPLDRINMFEHHRMRRASGFSVTKRLQQGASAES